MGPHFNPRTKRPPQRVILFYSFFFLIKFYLFTFYFVVIHLWSVNSKQEGIFCGNVFRADGKKKKTNWLTHSPSKIDFFFLFFEVSMQKSSWKWLKLEFRQIFKLETCRPKCAYADSHPKNKNTHEHSAFLQKMLMCETHFCGV